MKNRVISAILAAALITGYGCSRKKDSTDAAKDINKTKINDEATTSTREVSVNDQKDEAAYLVELADTGLTEYELSLVAVDRATNPRVKTYARELVSQHAAYEKGLRDTAQQRKLTLPTTLSQESQAMVSDLADETAGTDFDQKYLAQIKTINGKAISQAEGVRDNTQRIGIKNFANKLIADGENHRMQAEKLGEVL